MTDIAKPVDSPYYSAEFYETIRKVFYGSQKPIYNMTTNDWYSELLSTRVLYEWSVNDGKWLRPVLCEVLYPGNNWQQT